MKLSINPHVFLITLFIIPLCVLISCENRTPEPTQNRTSPSATPLNTVSAMPSASASANPFDDLGVMKDLIYKYLLANGKLERHNIIAPSLPDSSYASAYEKARRLASPELVSLLKDRGNDNLILNLDGTIRKYLSTDGETFICGGSPAPGNLTLNQYVKAWNRVVRAMPLNVREFLNRNDASAISILEATIRGCFRN